jgi:hypothetical protein
MHYLVETGGLNMSTDYIILAVIAVLGIGGGLFLLSQAESYRLRNRARYSK